MCIATVNTRPSLYTRKFDPVIYLFIFFYSMFLLNLPSSEKFRKYKEITVGFYIHIYTFFMV